MLGWAPPRGAGLPLCSGNVLVSSLHRADLLFGRCSSVTIASPLDGPLRAGNPTALQVFVTRSRCLLPWEACGWPAVPAPGQASPLSPAVGSSKLARLL